MLRDKFFSLIPKFHILWQCYAFQISFVIILFNNKDQLFRAWIQKAAEEFKTMDDCQKLYITIIADLQLAFKTYYPWCLRDKHVYAVDISHSCSKPLEFEVVKQNKHHILKLIQFNYLSYYTIQRMDRIVSEYKPGTKIKFRCPLCHEGYGSLWYPIQ